MLDCPFPEPPHASGEPTGGPYDDRCEGRRPRTGHPAPSRATRLFRHRLRRGHAQGARDGADPARARRGIGASALAPARDRAAPARGRALPLPPAQGLRRHGARLRGRRRHPRRAGARLPLHGLERGQPRLPPLDPRLLRPRDPARGVGHQPGRADRLVHRARRRPRAPGGRRLRRQRALAVLVGSGQLRLEHAGRHRPRRRRPDARRLAAVPGAEVRLRDRR